MTEKTYSPKHYPTITAALAHMNAVDAIHSARAIPEGWENEADTWQAVCAAEITREIETAHPEIIRVQIVSRVVEEWNHANITRPALWLDDSDVLDIMQADDEEKAREDAQARADEQDEQREWEERMGLRDDSPHLDPAPYTYEY